MSSGPPPPGFVPDSQPLDVTSFRSPFYDAVEAGLEQELGLPSGLVSAIRTRGERSNADQVSPVGARTVYQIMPQTRDLFRKKYGVDAYSSPSAAARVAALHLKESLERGGDPVREYHGGPDPRKWGPVNDAYAGRVGTFGGLIDVANAADAAPPPPPGFQMDGSAFTASAPAAPAPSGDSTADRIATIQQGLEAGNFAPEEAARLIEEIKTGKAPLTSTATYGRAFFDELPPEVSAKLTPEQLAQWQDLARNPRSSPQQLDALARSFGFDLLNEDEIVKARQMGAGVNEDVDYGPVEARDTGTGRAGAIARGAANSLTGNLAAEIQGLGRTSREWIEGDIPEGQTFGQRWGINNDFTEGAYKFDREQYPVSTFGAELGAGLLIPYGAAARTPGQLARVGGTYGTVYGFGAGDGGPIDRLDDAVLGAGMGAAGGAVMGAGIERLAPVARRGLDAVRSRLPGAAPASDAFNPGVLREAAYEAAPVAQDSVQGAPGSRPGTVQGAIADGRGEAAMAAEFDDAALVAAVDDAPLPAGFVDDAPVVRERDYIRLDGEDVPAPPSGFSLDEPQLGRVRPMGEQPTPEDIADAARRVMPEDVVPIPSNMAETADELPTSIAELEAPRLGRTPRRPIGFSEHLKARLREESSARGLPVRIDAEDAIDKGVPADLIYANPNVADRSQLRLRNPSLFGTRYGKMSRAQQQLRSLDMDDVDPVAWGFDAKAGGRLDPEEIGDLLRRDLEGDESALMRGGEYDAWTGYQERAAQRAEFEGRFPDAPPVERRGEPVGLDDLRGNEPPATAYEDLPSLGGRVGNIDVTKLETRADIRRALMTSEQKTGGLDASRRGRMSQQETAALASELNLTVDDLLRRRSGQALNAEQALAARRILAKSADELIALANKVQGGSDGDLVSFRKAWLRHVAIQEQVSGATAEAGRALAQFKMVARSKEAGLKVLKGLMEGSGGRERIEDAAEAILELQRDPGRLNRFTAEALKPKLSDKLVELWYNSILSGPATHVVNMVSNSLTALGQLPEHAIAAGIGLGRVKFNRANADRILFSEVGARGTGLLTGTREGLRHFARTFRTGEPSDFMSKVEARRHKAISGLKGEAIRIPTRLLSAEDELFKAMARRMELSGLAVRQARQEGLRGEAAKKRAAELTANPTDAMLERAFDYGRYVTFQRPLGRIAQPVSSITTAAPALKLVLPFIRTPTNLFKFALERSPAAPLLREVREDFQAGGARRDLAVARVLAGSGFGALIGQMAAEGHITGSGPGDEAATRLMRADGWQPYSILLGDKYYSYQRLDPFATTIGIAADLVTKGEHLTAKQQDRVATMLVTAIIQQMQSKTWLSGLTDLAQAVDDPDRYADAFIARLAGSMAVPTVVAHVAKTVDPVLREAKSPLDRIKSRLPGVSQSLPARRDVFGKKIKTEGGLGPDFLSPIWTNTRKNDPVIAAALDAGAKLSPPSKRVAGRDLSPEEYSTYQALAGRYVYDDLEGAVQDDEWAGMTNEERADWVSDIVRDARDDARADLGLVPLE